MTIIASSPCRRERSEIPTRGFASLGQNARMVAIAATGSASRHFLLRSLKSKFSVCVVAVTLLVTCGGKKTFGPGSWDGGVCAPAPSFGYGSCDGQKDEACARWGASVVTGVYGWSVCHTDEVKGNTRCSANPDCGGGSGGCCGDPSQFCDDNTEICASDTPDGPRYCATKCPLVSNDGSVDAFAD